jgi:hypothetical protein
MRVCRIHLTYPAVSPLADSAVAFSTETTPEHLPLPNFDSVYNYIHGTIKPKRETFTGVINV